MGVVSTAQMLRAGPPLRDKERKLEYISFFIFSPAGGCEGTSVRLTFRPAEGKNEREKDREKRKRNFKLKLQYGDYGCNLSSSGGKE